MSGDVSAGEGTKVTVLSSEYCILPVLVPCMSYTLTSVVGIGTLLVTIAFQQLFLLSSTSTIEMQQCEVVLSGTVFSTTIEVKFTA